MQMMSMSMKSGGSESTSNFSGSGSLVKSTVDLGVELEGVRWRRGFLHIRRASNSNRTGAGNAYGGEHAMGMGGRSRVGSYPLNPFDVVLLDQYVFTLFYCLLILLTFVVTSDERTGELLRRLNTPDSPTFHDYGSSPP